MTDTVLGTMDNLVIKTQGTQNLVEEVDLLTNQNRDSNTLHKNEPRARRTHRKKGLILTGPREGFAEGVTFELDLEGWSRVFPGRKNSLSRGTGCVLEEQGAGGERAGAEGGQCWWRIAEID